MSKYLIQVFEEIRSDVRPAGKRMEEKEENKRARASQAKGGRD
jgi:hypothetical protein